MPGAISRLRMSPESVFDVPACSDLGSRSLTGGLSTLGGQALRSLVQLVGTMVLARLLTPDDYGLLSMTAVVIAFAQLFKDAGLSMATVQQRRITRGQISTLFWFNAAVSTGVAALVAAGAPLVGGFYGRQELVGLTAALSVSFVISGVTMQHAALLKRNMRFTPLAVSVVGGQLANTVIAIALAISGARYWALAGGLLAGSAVQSALTVFFCPWVPSRPQRGTGVRVMLRFGGDVVGFNLVNYFARNADNVLIGRFLGADALGLYSRAYQLFMLPINQIRAPMTDVGMSVLSTLQDSPRRYARYFKRLIDLLALAAVPIAAYCVIESSFVIEMLLGRQWLGAAEVLRWLGLAGLVQAVASTVGLLQLSLGRSREYLYLGLFNAVMTVGAFVMALPLGIVGIAQAYAAVNGLMLIPAAWYATRRSPVRLRDFLGSLVRPLTYAAAASGLAFLATPSVTSLGHHAVRLVVYCLVYMGCVAGSAHWRRELRKLLGLVLTLRKGNSSQTADHTPNTE